MNVLERIFAEKRNEVANAKKILPMEEMRLRAEQAEPARGFRAALEQPPGLALIAEVKKASPSQGVIRPDFNPVEIARAYEHAGAQCLSVLTDGPNFQGSLENLKLCRTATSLPCLRKDFVFDPYQIYEAQAWGADAILLIVAMLSREEIESLQLLARSLGMDVLVEVHNEDEVNTALQAGANLIGVNNRDLKDFKTSLSVSERLLPLVAPHALAVSESALATKGDLDKVHGWGAKAVLIGTTFCRATDVEGKVREVTGW